MTGMPSIVGDSMFAQFVRPIAFGISFGDGCGRRGAVDAGASDSVAPPGAAQSAAAQAQSGAPVAYSTFVRDAWFNPGSFRSSRRPGKVYFALSNDQLGKTSSRPRFPRPVSTASVGAGRAVRRAGAHPSLRAHRRHDRLTLLTPSLFKSRRTRPRTRRADFAASVDDRRR